MKTVPIRGVARWGGGGILRPVIPVGSEKRTRLFLICFSDCVIVEGNLEEECEVRQLELERERTVQPKP